MLCWKQVIRAGLLALVVLGVSVALISVSTHPSYAQATTSLADPGSITDPGSGPKPGDPDGPTGDLPPSSGGRLVTNGSGTPSTSTGIVPERRVTIWASWQVMLKLWARSAFLY